MADKKIVSLDSQWFNGIQNCPQKLKYQLLDGLRPHTMPAPLERGSLLHHIFDLYYRGRMEGIRNHKDLLHAALESGEKFAIDTDLPSEEVREVMKASADNLNFHQHDGWVPLAVEQPFSYTLYEDDNLMIVSTGVIDLVVDIRGAGITVVDHKSSKRASTPSPLSNQFMNYCYGTRTNRAVVNQVGFQKTVPAEQKFKRVVLSYTNSNLEEWRNNTVFWVKFGLGCQDSGNFPMNFTSCDKYGGCIYSELCLTTPDAREWKTGVKFVKGEPWDPYKKDR